MMSRGGSNALSAFMTPQMAYAAGRQASPLIEINGGGMLPALQLTPESTKITVVEQVFETNTSKHSTKMRPVTAMDLKTQHKCRSCLAIAVKLTLRDEPEPTTSEGWKRLENRARKSVAGPDVLTHLICEYCSIILCKSCSLRNLYVHPESGTKRGCGLREEYDVNIFESLKDYIVLRGTENAAHK